MVAKDPLPRPKEARFILTCLSMLVTTLTFSQCEQQELVGSTAIDNARFGTDVSMDGSVAVIGAPLLGAAFVFRLVESEWIEESVLQASDGQDGNRFGGSVSVDGDVVVIGAHHDDALGNRSGAAFVFRYDGSQWVEEAKLTANDGIDDDFFGRTVSIDDSTILIGAPGDDDSGSFSGSA